MSNFITPKELLSCLDEVIILDARGYQDYQKGHIKGSYAVDLNKDLTGPFGRAWRSSSIAGYGAFGSYF